MTTLPASGAARLAVGNSTGFADVPAAAPASVVRPGNSENESTLKPESRNPVSGEIEKPAYPSREMTPVPLNTTSALAPAIARSRVPLGWRVTASVPRTSSRPAMPT